MAVNLKKALPKAHFGKANHDHMNWEDHESDDDADDVELKHTPKDVVGMLGFDPKKKLKTSIKPVISKRKK